MINVTGDLDDMLTYEVVHALGVFLTLSRTGRIYGIAAGAAIKMRGSNYPSAGTATYERRHMQVTPVRVA